MVGEPRRGTLARDGHVERGERELMAEVVGHGPADDTAREQVEHHGQVQPALSNPDIGVVQNLPFSGYTGMRKAPAYEGRIATGRVSCAGGCAPPRGQARRG